MAFTLTESLKGMSVEDFLGLTEWKLGYFGVRSATPADAPRFKDCTTQKGWTCTDSSHLADSSAKTSTQFQ